MFVLGKNPFNQRRQTAQEDEFNESTFAGPGQQQQPPVDAPTGRNGRQNERKNTSGTLNRNESQS